MQYTDTAEGWSAIDVLRQKDANRRQKKRDFRLQSTTPYLIVRPQNSKQLK